MMALLNMWRLEGYDKINAKFFCQKYGTRLKMAITFSALMGGKQIRKVDENFLIIILIIS